MFTDGEGTTPASNRQVNVRDSTQNNGHSGKHDPDVHLGNTFADRID